MKSLFVAATRQNDGKTMTSLGLFQALNERFAAAGYMKPVGQQYLLIDNKKIDKDAVLFHQTFESLQSDSLENMSPIAVPRGFTESYIFNPIKDTLTTRLLHHNEALSKGKDFILYEGTGHAGVGSVFEMSNARSAKLLGSKVVLVSLGGIGSAIDEIMLNMSTFLEQGVEVIGVILNKVLPKKYDKVDKTIRQGFKNFGVDVLGVIPWVSELTHPSVPALIDTIQPDILCQRQREYAHIERFILADTLPQDALKNNLLIIPSATPELAKSALTNLRPDQFQRLAAVILTDGFVPEKTHIDTFKSEQVPLLSVSEDAFSVCQRLNTKTFKIGQNEPEKIRIAAELVKTHVDIDRICEQL